jgi:hypothetical protein
VTFKNELERRCFEIAAQAIGGGSVHVEHNKSIQIESALFPEVAAFKGPPAKEIDVLVAELLDTPKVVLLVSCKLLSRRAEPAHIQEWGAVVQTMNKYSKETLYLGMVIAPTGFTSGSESWATSHNIAVLPPIKGKRLAFSEETVLRMFDRTLEALKKRIRLRIEDLEDAPGFYDFAYRLVQDFEGHQEVASDGRYFLAPHGWVSSFGEMYRFIEGYTVRDVFAIRGATVITTDEGVNLRFAENRIDFGHDDSLLQGERTDVGCRKNIEMEACTLDFVRSLVAGHAITSAGDFGSYLEFGLDQRFNLGLHQNSFHLISTENPIEGHRL